MIRRALLLLLAWTLFWRAVEEAEPMLLIAADYAHPVLDWLDEL